MTSKINTKTLIVLIISIISIISTYYLYNHFKDNDQEITNEVDKFGISQIYPTKNEEREWYIDMQNPKQTRNMFLTGNETIVRQPDGSWRTSGPLVKINVDTPAGGDEWKNIEMAGYFRIISILNDNGGEDEEGTGSDINLLARGGRHTNDSPCEGTSLIGTIKDDGSASWRKEIWHTGGYTDEKDVTKATNSSLVEKWIGWKVIMYNIENDAAAKNGIIY